MRNLLTFILLVFSIGNTLAQEIDYDKKTGLVLLDGKEAFYFTNVGTIFDQAYKLENLARKELAFYKDVKVGEKYNSTRGKMESVFVYRATFSNSLNTCDISGLSTLRSILKDIVNYGLVKNGEIDPLAEERYVLGNGGQLQRNVEPSRVIVNVSPQENTETSVASNQLPLFAFEDLRTENDQIYNKEILIGSFKQSNNNGINTIIVYNSSDNKVAIATHEDNSENDWSVFIVETSQKVEIRYYSQATLNKLFFSLAQSDILK